MTSNYYCAGSHCRKTTQRVRVRMANQTFYYCVDCGRRLESRDTGSVQRKPSARVE